MASTDCAGGDGVDDVDFFEINALDSEKFVYDMNHPRRGKFIIINNHTFLPETQMPKRSGTDKDAASLYEIFRNFGFEVSLHQDLKRDQMLKKVIDATKEDYSDCDCFGMAILSHGGDGVVYGIDDVIAIDSLVTPVKRCRSLVGKPKLFFFQASRGQNLDDGIQSDGIGETGSPRIVIPLEADCLCAYSTVPGSISWEDSSKGSWFVQALTQILKKPECGKMDLLHVLTRVNHAVANQFESNESRPDKNRKKQVPSIVSMLTKDLYLCAKK